MQKDYKNSLNTTVGPKILSGGGRNSIVEYVREYNVDKIYIALPSIPAKERKKIIDICKETDCEIRNLPGMYQLALGDVSVNSLKKVDVEGFAVYVELECFIVSSGSVWICAGILAGLYSTA